MSLDQARQAVARNDLVDLKLETARQHNLTREVSTLIGSSKLTDELKQIELRVRSLNREYAAMLRRARRTVDIFCRLLADSSVTYSPPIQPSTPLTDRERDQACQV